MESFKYKYFLLIAVVCLLAACERSTLHETMRITSPDHMVDAVIATVDTDATVATPTKLFIVPTGTKITDTESVLVADNLQNFTVSWQSSKKLVVSFSSGRVFSFTNFWESREVNNFQYVVRIYLRDNNSP